MKCKYIIAILTLFLTSVNLFGQTKEDRVVTAYGYLKGQEHSLNLIKTKFPELGSGITKAETDFNSSFGTAHDRIRNYLLQFMGERQLKETDEKLITELDKILGKQPFTKETSIKFISEVEDRAKGNIQSPILETLLSFQYSDKPQDELLNGFTTTFKTSGRSKSKGTDWQIKVPKSWKAEEADDPNIIQKFVSDFGDGVPAFMLMVQELPLPEGYKITKEEISEVFTEKGVKDMVPADGKFISFTKMTLDNNIGGMLELEQTSEQPDFKIKIRMVQFMLVKSNKMYLLQGTLYSKKDKADLSLDMQKYLPLFKLVANSIVVSDKDK